MWNISYVSFFIELKYFLILPLRAGDIVTTVGRTSSTTTDEMFVKDSEGNNPGTNEKRDLNIDE